MPRIFCPTLQFTVRMIISAAIAQENSHITPEDTRHAVMKKDLVTPIVKLLKTQNFQMVQAAIRLVQEFANDGNYL
jgi:protein tyrosine phosphatase